MKILSLVCNFMSHEKCLKQVKMPCAILAPRLVHVRMAHCTQGIGVGPHGLQSCSLSPWSPRSCHPSCSSPCSHRFQSHTALDPADCIRGASVQCAEGAWRCPRCAAKVPAGLWLWEVLLGGYWARHKQSFNPDHLSVCELHVHPNCVPFACSDCRQCHWDGHWDQVSAGHLPTHCRREGRVQRVPDLACPPTNTPWWCPQQDTHLHHWREGNPPSCARCQVCKKTCGSSDVLAGIHCEWCGMQVSMCLSQE